MKFTALSSIAALAASSNALLIPPSVSVADADFWDGAAPVMTSHNKATVYLDCPSCPIAVGNVGGQPQEWRSGADTELLLEITSRDGRIFLNEMPIYPASADMQPVSAKQVSIKQPWTNPEPLFNGPIPLSTSIEVHPHVEVDSLQIDGPSQGFQKVPMRRLSIDVLGMDGRVVRLESVEVRFREDTLEIFDVGTTPAAPFQPDEKACANVLCRFFEIVREKAARVGQLASAAVSKVPGVKSGHKKAGCAKHMKGMPAANMPNIKGGVAKFGGKFDDQGNFKGFGPDAPQGHGHRHGQHHHRGFCIRRVLHRVAGFLNHFVLPVATGIAVGMAVSGVGMLLGQAMLMLYMRLRYGRQGYASLEDVEVLVIEEAEPEFLPKYEDVAEPAPQYTDEKSEQ